MRALTSARQLVLFTSLYLGCRSTPRARPVCLPPLSGTYMASQCVRRMVLGFDIDADFSVVDLIEAESFQPRVPQACTWELNIILIRSH